MWAAIRHSGRSEPKPILAKRKRSWPGDAPIAVNIVINVEEGSEPSVPDGDAETEQGLTEGDPRNPEAPNGRFILPRSVKFSVGYSF